MSEIAQKTRPASMVLCQRLGLDRKVWSMPFKRKCTVLSSGHIDQCFERTGHEPLIMYPC